MNRRGFLKTLALIPLAMKIAITEPVQAITTDPWEEYTGEFKWLNQTDVDEKGFYMARFEAFPTGDEVKMKRVNAFIEHEDGTVSANPAYEDAEYGVSIMYRRNTA